jgi:CHAT domain-containing protein
MTRAPSRVVLSACESARSGDDAPPEGLGLAQAFLTAGADLVIAPTRRVPDALAADLTRALYEQLSDPRGDAAEALRAAQTRLAREQPGSDWPAFRVLRP